MKLFHFDNKIHKDNIIEKSYDLSDIIVKAYSRVVNSAIDVTKCIYCKDYIDDVYAADYKYLYVKDDYSEPAIQRGYVDFSPVIVNEDFLPHLKRQGYSKQDIIAFIDACSNAYVGNKESQELLVELFPKYFRIDENIEYLIPSGVKFDIIHMTDFIPKN